MTPQPKLIRFADLEPSWTVKQATEPGFMRWLVSWLGGPPGFVNFNPGLAADSSRTAMGFMAMPQGNRQAGLHKHSVTEIYVILQGEIEGFDHTGVPHRAGPLDCIVIPAGVPHGVRTCGTADLHLMWAHDAPERVGVSAYMDTAQPGDSDEHIHVVRMRDQEPSWRLPGAMQAGTMRWQVGYVGSGPGEVGNPLVSLGMTCIPSGNLDRITAASHDRLYLCVGDAVIARSEQWTETLHYLDAVHVPAGGSMVFWNHGDTPARLLWLYEQGQSGF